MRRLLLSIAIAFVTLFAAVQSASAQVTVYRVNENFDNVSSGLPTGWDNTQGTSTEVSRWAVNGSGYNGTRGLMFDCQFNTIGSYNVLFTPAVDLSMDGWLLTFRYKVAGDGDLSVYLSTDGGATYRSAPVALNLPPVMNWTQKSYSITALAGGSANVKVAFVGTVGNGGYNSAIYLDDVTVESAPTCQAPEAIMAQGVTETSVGLMWGLTPDGATPSQYFITVTDQAGNAVMSNQAISAPSQFYNLTGLTSNTTYTVTLKGDCSAAHQGQSDQASFTFTTLCPAGAAPYTENFDALTGVPGCSYGKNVGYNTMFRYGPTGQALALTTSSTEEAYIIFPEVSLAANNVEVAFFIRPETVHNGAQQFTVGLISDPYDPSTYDPILADSLTTTQWREIRVNTAQYNGYHAGATTVRPAIMVSGGINHSTFIDNVSVHAVPTCIRPEDLVVSHVTATEATLGWRAATAPQYIVEAASAAGTTYTTVTTNPCTVTGLTPNADYTFRVAALCSGADTSEFNPYSVEAHTLCVTAATPIFNEGFEQLTQANRAPECWQMGWLTKPASVTTVAPFTATTVQKHGGSRAMQLVAMPGGTRSLLSSVALPIDQANKYVVRLWVRRDAVAEPDADEGFRVWVNTTPETTAGATLLGHIHRHIGLAPTEGQAGWHEYEYVIPTSGDLHIIVEGISAGSELYLDDISVAQAPACVRPRAVEVDSIGTHQVGLTWQAGLNETEWSLSYAVLDGRLDTVTSATVPVTGTPAYTITGLEPSVSYTIAGTVTALCSATSASEPQPFRYNIDMVCGTITDLPYNESFEGWRFPPLCWTETNYSVVKENWTRASGRAADGTSAITVATSTAGSRPALITPAINFAAGTPLEVRFAMNRSGNYGENINEGLHVLVGPDVDDSTTAVNIGVIPQYYMSAPAAAQPGMAYYSLPVPQSVTGANHIFFVYYSEGGVGTTVDDITLRPVPTCADLACIVTGRTHNTVRVAVTDSTATGWQLSYGTVGTTPEHGTIISCSGRLDTVVTGLAPETEYCFYVRRVCGAEQGFWSRAERAKTFCAPATVPLFDDFENTATDNSLDVNGCYIVSGTTNYVKTLADGDGYVYNHTTGGSRGISLAYTANAGSMTSVHDRVTVTRTVHLLSGHNYEVSLFVKAFQYAYGPGEYDYNLSFVLGSTADELQTLYTGLVSNADFERRSVYFDVPSDGDYVVGFVTEGAHNNYYLLFADDYSVREVPCIPPTGSTVAALTSSTATIGFTSNAELWEMAVSTSPIDISGTVTGEVYHNDTLTRRTVNLTGLTVNTEYYYTIRAICNGTPSDWMTPGSFRTRCTAVSLPYSNDFATAFATTCWSSSNAGTVSHTSVEGNSAAGAMQLNGVVGISPELNVSTLAGYMIDGYVKADEDSTMLDYGVMTDPDNIESYEPLGSVLITPANTWIPFTAYFNELSDPDYAHVAGARYIALVPGIRNVYVDDITIDQTPTCPKPTSCRVLQALPRQLTLDWTDNAQAAQWIIRAQATGSPDVTTTVSAHPAVISGLMPATAYTVSVAAICSATDTSAWAQVAQLVTDCDFITEDYNESFEGFAENQTPTCYDISSSTYAQIGTYPERIFGVFTSGGNKSIRMDNYYVTRGCYAEIRTPEFVLPAGKSNSFGFDLCHQADCGDLSLYIERRSAAGRVLAGTYSRNSMDYSHTAPAAWFTEKVDLTAYAGDTVSLVFSLMPNFGSGAVFIDNIMMQENLSCSDINGLSITAVGEHTARAVFADTCAAHAEWEYAVVSRGSGVSAATPAITTATTINLTGLAASSNYDLYVRSRCGEGDCGHWFKASFNTTNTPAELPYVCTFADQADNSLWLTQQQFGSNGFVIGTDPAAAINGGSSLYVSNNRSDYYYYPNDPSLCYAIRAVNFGSGEYSIEADWQCSGGYNMYGSAYNFARLYMVPAYADFTPQCSGQITSSSASAFTLPSDAILIDDGQPIFMAYGPQHSYRTVDMTGREGVYKLVFLWRNTGNNTAAQAPLAVDNIAIRPVTCQPVRGIAVSEATLSSAEATFDNPDGDIIRYVVSSSPVTADSVLSGTTRGTTVSLAGLAASTTYTFMARRECSDAAVSAWSSLEFATECADAEFPITENFDGPRFPATCWSEYTVAPGSLYNAESDGHWTRQSGGNYFSPVNGIYGIGLSQGSGAAAALVSPRFVLEAGRDYHCSLYLYTGGTAYAVDSYDFYLSQQPVLNDDALLVKSVPATNGSASSSMMKQDIDLPSGLAGSYYLIIVGRVDDAAQHELYIDDITIDVYPLCRDLAAPTVDAVTATTATVSAAMHGQSAVEFGIAPYSAVATTASIVSTIVSTTGRAKFTGLNPGSSYLFFARAICASTGDTTAWTSSVNGQTKADDCFAPERVRVLSLLDNAATICWNDIPNAATCVYRLAGPTLVTGTTTNDTVVLTGLVPLTTYSLSVAGLCGSDTTLFTTLTFRTIGTPTELPYSTGFELTADNALWENRASQDYNSFAIGGTDVQGKADGQRGLYITTDGQSYGQSVPGEGLNTFNNIYNVVYATRAIHFPHAGSYEVSFDWKCNPVIPKTFGYYDAWGRAFIAPTDVDLAVDDNAYASIDPAGSIGLMNRMTGANDWTEFRKIVTVESAGYRNIVFEYVAYNRYDFATADEASAVPLAVDNLSIAEVTCLPVSSVRVLDIRDTRATVRVVKADPVDIDYALSTVATADSITTWNTLTSQAKADTLRFDSLAASTVYYLYVRQACDAQDKSTWTRTRLVTTTAPATLPYVCDFETTSENNLWLYAGDGQANYFVIGSGASNGGQRGLYVTTNGTANGYNANVEATSYAYRTFYLEPGIYSYGYEWSSNGDSYGGDYGRAFLTPYTTALSAGAKGSKIVPRGSIGLDGGENLMGSLAWLEKSGTFEIETAGSYNLCFAWTNNNTIEGQPPLALDNIRLDRVTCPQPAVTVDNIASNSARVKFTGIPEGASVEYAITPTGSITDAITVDTLAYIGATATATIAGLASSSSYFVLARALCSASDASPVTTVRFNTACTGFTAFPYYEDFEAMTATPYRKGTAVASANLNDIQNFCWLVGSSNALCGTTISNGTGSRISGLNTLVIDNYPGTQSDWTVAALPVMDSISTLNISFRYFSEFNAPAEIGYLTGSETATSFVGLATVPVSNEPVEFSMRLNAAPASARRIAIRYTGYYFLYIDDIRVNRTVNAAAVSDTVCYESGYTGHGLNVENTELAVGNNTFTRLERASATGVADTLVTVNVYRRPQALSEIYDTICAGSAYTKGLWNIPADQVASQRYFDNFPNAAASGCDSTQVLYLTVLPSSRLINDTICAGSSYLFGDQTLTATGLYTRQYQSAWGCDMTDSLALFVLPDTIRRTETICENQTPYVWNGRSLTASGVYRATITGPRGCSQTEELALTVITADSTVTAHFCAGGQAYVVDTIITAPGTYTLVRVNPNGCDIRYHITAVEDAVITGTAQDYVCQGQLYYGNGINGLSVAADTVATVATRTADSQCDSVTLVSIHMVAPVYVTVNETIQAGEVYTWNDQTYNAAGTYVDTLVSSDGCDSVVTLNLSVIDGVDNVADLGRMRIVPNPAVAGAQTLVFTEQTGRIVRVEILNSFGAVVDSREPHATPISITAPQTAGIYHVRVTTAEGRVYVEKLIVR